uniref:ATS domain-containing protein n=1 Tax=Strongyloides stercoralis TaxID=6248 RepID=A0A0K0ELI8_STRER
MSIINQSNDFLLKDNNENMLLDSELPITIVNDNKLDEEYAYSKHLKSPVTLNLPSINTSSAFTSEFDYSYYTLSDQDTTIVTLGPDGVEKMKMKYFDGINKENISSTNDNKTLINTKEGCNVKEKDFFYDSSYDISSYDSYYQSQSLQTFVFY